jgi:hypothetical protein
VKISQLKDENTNEIEILRKTTIHQLKNVYIIAMKTTLVKGEIQCEKDVTSG